MTDISINQYSLLIDAQGRTLIMVRAFYSYSLTLFVC